MKCGFVSFVGRPSSGKSTLLNSLCQERVTITSPKPQTTRRPVRGIIHHNLGQIIILDTPGYHDEQSPLNTELRGNIRRCIEDSDTLLYLIDASRKIGREEQLLAELIQKTDCQPLIAVNKTDLVDSLALSKVERFVKEIWSDSQLQYISAKTLEGLEELKNVLIDRLPEGPLLYPQDVYTDQNVEFRISEIIREQAIACTQRELPYSLYVEIVDLIEQEDAPLLARAAILVERESQKGIVVGHQGKRIRDIRKQAERRLRQIFPYRIDLDLRVKVHRGWRKNAATLKKLFSI